MLSLSLSLLQSKTPALVFEYINNTDFKVSLGVVEGSLPFLLKLLSSWVVRYSSRAVRGVWVCSLCQLHLLSFT